MNRRRLLKYLASAAAVSATPLSAYAKTYDFRFTRVMYESGNWEVDERMPSNLLNSLLEYTNINIDPNEYIVPLADPRILRAPFLYMAGHRLVQFTPEEARHFEAYVRGGGFIFVDDCNHDIDGLFARSFEQQMAAIFGPEALAKIPNDHPIYSSFFHFEDGPPATSLELNGWGDDLVHEYLKAIEIDGRIRVLYSNKDYGCEWDYDFRNKRWLARDNTRFGVNVVVYAMTS